MIYDTRRPSEDAQAARASLRDGQSVPLSSFDTDFVLDLDFARFRRFGAGFSPVSRRSSPVRRSLPLRRSTLAACIRSG
jgi:hypothetical protein